MQKRPQMPAAVVFLWIFAGDVLRSADVFGGNLEFVSLRVVPEDHGVAGSSRLEHALPVPGERAHRARGMEPAVGTGGERRLKRLDGPVHEGEVAYEPLGAQPRGEKRVARFGRCRGRCADAPEGPVERGEGCADRVALDDDRSAELEALVGRAVGLSLIHISEPTRP